MESPKILIVTYNSPILNYVVDSVIKSSTHFNKPKIIILDSYRYGKAYNYNNDGITYLRYSDLIEYIGRISDKLMLSKNDKILLKHRFFSNPGLPRSFGAALYKRGPVLSLDDDSIIDKGIISTYYNAVKTGKEVIIFDNKFGVPDLSLFEWLRIKIASYLTKRQALGMINNKTAYTKKLIEDRQLFSYSLKVYSNIFEKDTNLIDIQNVPLPPRKHVNGSCFFTLAENLIKNPMPTLYDEDWTWETILRLKQVQVSISKRAFLHYNNERNNRKADRLWSKDGLYNEEFGKIFGKVFEYFLYSKIDISRIPPIKIVEKAHEYAIKSVDNKIALAYNIAMLMKDNQNKERIVCLLSNLQEEISKISAEEILDEIRFYYLTKKFIGLVHSVI